MRLLKYVYEKNTGKKAPYYYSYLFTRMLGRPIRKFFAQVVAPNILFINLKIFFYYLCGFRIGKHILIGMKCYLDDMCYDLLKIGSDVTISYGGYFACYGRNQGYYPIRVEDGAYIGMRESVILKNTDNKFGGGGFSCWSLQPCKQKYLGRRGSSWYPMQNYGESACLRNEVLVA